MDGGGLMALYLGNEKISAAPASPIEQKLSQAAYLSGVNVGQNQTLPLNADTLGGKKPEYYLCNYNLLDNSNFLNPVNQRGAASYTTDGYCIDRWAIASGMMLNVSNHTLTGSNASNNSLLYQRLLGLFLGQTYTLSLKVNGEILQATHQLGADSSEMWGSFSWGRVSVYREASSGVATVLIYVNNGTTIAPDWVKLEEGNFSTEYRTKSYMAELTECQFYFRTLFVTAVRTTGSLFSVSREINMRVAPTPVFKYFSPYGAANVTNFAGCTLEATPTTLGYANLPTCSAHAAGGLNFDLSADL